MYWIIGIILVVIISLKLLLRFTISKNVTARYYALKDIFANDDEISNKQYLEMAGIISQIIDVKSGKISILDIRKIAEESSLKFDNENSEHKMLYDFCYNIIKLVFLGNEGSYNQTSIRVAESHFKSIEKDISYVKNKGYSKMVYRSTVNFISKNPDCLSGVYDF